MIEIDGISYYTVDETAERLRIGAQSLRVYMSYKRIEYTKIERRSYFTDTQIEKFLKPRKDKLVKPVANWRDELENMVNRVYAKYSRGVRA